ncbi:MAG: ATP-binding protein [Deltaproteobacteria bacterium]|nr:ATP-binding protein [Deltaproteobacteria bacterium]
MFDWTDKAEAEFDVTLTQLFRGLRRNTVDFFIATDPWGMIRLASPNVEFLLDCKASELQDMHIRTLFEERKNHAGNLMERLAEEGELENLEMVLNRKSGDHLHVNLSASQLSNPAGQGIGFIFLLRDITEKKKLENQLRHAQKMEAVGTLAGGIAHDFNNLLTGIQGYVSLMLFDMPPRHPHREALRNIEHHVQSGADLTKKLLGFAKGGKYEVKPTDMNDLVKKSAKFFGRTRKEVKVHGHYAEPLWSAEVDASQIEHVLLNLYINAWQAMPEGGNLHLATENIFLDDLFLKAYPPAKPGPYVKVSVGDDGIGMDEATAHRVFEPFFTTKERGRGTGLGLASAYGIVKSHGGVIKVHSRVGRGTTVTFYLPASSKAVIQEVKPPRVRMKRGSETILLIDDEESLAKITAELLGIIGYRVLAAHSGPEGIALFKDHRDEVSLVILDMIMPGMTGRETFDILKQLNPSLKILLSSGYSLNGQAREMLSQGCGGFIQKPYEINKLSEKIRSLLANDDSAADPDGGQKLKAG